MKIINIHIMKKITFSILFVWLSLSLWAARQPEFSTAGFFRLDNSGREVYSMNPAWRFHKGAVESAETKEFNDNKGTYPKDQQLRWETLDEMRNRIQRVADKYANYNKVILVGHDMAFRTLTYIKKIRPAEIVELEYFSGQSKCEYFFS